MSAPCVWLGVPAVLPPLGHDDSFLSITKCIAPDASV
jgi:hypothetical protein